MKICDSDQTCNELEPIYNDTAASMPCIITTALIRLPTLCLKMSIPWKSISHLPTHTRWQGIAAIRALYLCIQQWFSMINNKNPPQVEMPKSTMIPNPIWNHVYTLEIMTFAHLVLSDLCPAKSSSKCFISHAVWCGTNTCHGSHVLTGDATAIWSRSINVKFASKMASRAFPSLFTRTWHLHTVNT